MRGDLTTHAELPQLPCPFFAFLQAKLQSLHETCGEVAMIAAELGWLTEKRFGCCGVTPMLRVLARSHV